MTTPLEAALGYAAFCGVFPCTAKKMPIKIEGLFEHGFASATSDPVVIRTAWATYTAADIGLAPPRGVLVVDVDVAKGKAATISSAYSAARRRKWRRRSARRREPVGTFISASPLPFNLSRPRSRRVSMSALAAWATSSRLPPATVGGGFSHSYRRRSWRRRNGSWSG
jgi:hypothetical protein